MDNLRDEARRLEKEAKAEREDLNKKANLFLEAAKIWQQIGNERNWKWNVANYHIVKGEIYWHNSEFHKARECFKKAGELHLELNLPKAACYCASKHISTYYRDNLYYTEPIRGIMNNMLRPKITIEAEKLPEKSI